MGLVHGEPVLQGQQYIWAQCLRLAARLALGWPLPRPQPSPVDLHYHQKLLSRPWAMQRVLDIASECLGMQHSNHLHRLYIVFAQSIHKAKTRKAKITFCTKYKSSSLSS